MKLYKENIYRTAIIFSYIFGNEQKKVVSLQHR